MYTPTTLQPILDSFSLPARVWVAYSGGLDSHVLLHSMAQLRGHYPDMQLRAVHIHHGLSTQASSWSEHCQHVCQALGIDCVVKQVDPAVYVNPANIEATARDVRYQLLAELVSPGDYVMTAHHQDDQAETLLLRLLRGAGPAGLSAMAVKRSLGQGSLIRPLLTISRAALQDYARREGLVWVEDESNAQTQFTRNFLRHEVLPLLQSRWPGLGAVLARTARHCRETQRHADTLAQQDLLQVSGGTVGTLSVTALRTLTYPRQKNVLRWWLKQVPPPASSGNDSPLLTSPRKRGEELAGSAQWRGQIPPPACGGRLGGGSGFKLPSSQQLAHVIRDVVMAKPDAMPQLTWDGVEIRRFEDELYAISPLPAHDVTAVIPWDMRMPCEIAGIGRLIAREVAVENNPLPNLPPQAGEGAYWLLPCNTAWMPNFLPQTGEEGAYMIQTLWVPRNAQVTVQFRRGGEYLRLPEMHGSHSLKKLLQEWRVPPWLRDRIPLLYINGELAAVVGYALAI